MSRVRIEIPEGFDHRVELDVRIGDLNYGNHLGHDRLLTLLHEARARFFIDLGHHELDIEGLSLVIADLAVVYRAEVHHGDRLSIEMKFGEFKRVSCDLFYRARRVRSTKHDTTDQGEIVAEAKTGLVFLDARARAIASVPEVLRTRYSKPER